MTSLQRRFTAPTFACVPIALCMSLRSYALCAPAGAPASQVSALVCGAHLAPTSRAFFAAASRTAQVHAQASDALRPSAWQRQGVRAFASAPAAAEAPANAAAAGSSADAPVQLTDTAVQVTAAVHLHPRCASVCAFAHRLQEALLLGPGVRECAAND